MSNPRPPLESSASSEAYSESVFAGGSTALPVEVEAEEVPSGNGEEFVGSLHVPNRDIEGKGSTRKKPEAKPTVAWSQVRENLEVCRTAHTTPYVQVKAQGALDGWHERTPTKALNESHGVQAIGVNKAKGIPSPV